MKKLRYTIAVWLLLFWVEAVNWIGLISPEAVLEGIVVYAKGVLKGAGFRVEPK